VRIDRGARSALKAFSPSVVLEIGSSDWSWGATDLGRLHSDAARIAGGQWYLLGPVVLRAGFCVLRFDAGIDGPPSAPTTVLRAFQELKGFEGAAVAVPREDGRLIELRSLPGCATLRVFPRAEGATLGRIPRVWLDEALGAVEDRYGSPAALTFGAFRSSGVDDLSRAADVIREVDVPQSGIGCSAVWFRGDEGGLLVGSTGGVGLQVAIIGLRSRRIIAESAEWLRQLGLRLAEVTEPAYARVSLEPTGLGAFSPFSRTQPGAPASPNPSVTERHLDEWAPDAYWWQLIDRRLAQRLPGGLHERTLSSHLVELAFGDALDWVPVAPWAGDLNAPESVDPLDQQSTARAYMAPLLWGF
jgi:hypothetical protein